VCWLLRTQLRELGVSYAIALALGVGLVAWTGYRGGQLSLGRNHLTEHMPNGLRNLLGVEDSSALLASSADPNTFYGARIQPIFSARCINCHGTDKHKGNLRLDSYRALMRGGKDGTVIQTGNIQGSDLFRRITLPVGHDDFMPKGKPPLTADEVKTIELWIGAGASDKIAINAIKDAPSGSAVPTEVKFEEIDPTAVAKLRAPIAPAVAKLQKQFPNILDYYSRGAADLRLNASLLGSKFGDRDLEAFAPIAEHIIVADFSRTAITDHSAAAIAAMKRLRVLRLMDTRLTDATFLHLETLNQLESLDVYGTPITPAVLPAIAKLTKLSHFYAGQTGIAPGKSVPENLVGKLVF
jgi:mono/diheme cytochrome c family protein